MPNDEAEATTHGDPLAIDALSLVSTDDNAGDLEEDDTTVDDETEEETETEDSDEDSEDEDDSEGDDGEEDDEDETEEEDDEDDEDADALDDDEDDRFALDPDVVEALPEKARTRLEQQIKGLRKIEKRVQTAAPKIEAFDSMIASLDDPERVSEVLRHIANTAATHHGKTVAALLGLAPGQSAAAAGEGEFDTSNFAEEGYDSPGEMLAYLRGKAESKQELDRELAPLKEIQKERQEAAQKAALKAYAEKRAPGVAERIAKTHSGFSVTPDMVAEAVTAFPQLKEKPTRAVEAHFSRAISKHVAARQTERARRGPESPKSSGRASGFQLPKNPLEVTAADLIKYGGG